MATRRPKINWSVSLNRRPRLSEGKASKPTEFGELVKIQEAENQIVIAYDVYEQRPNDKDLLVSSGDTPATP